MGDQEGFVIMLRKIMHWEWYTSPNTAHLFMHCILRANYTDTVWRGIKVKRGSFITSLNTLSDETGLTVKQVRTSLDKLVSTGEIKDRSTSKYRIITVKKYDEYQSDGRQQAVKGQSEGKQRADKGQSDDKQRAYKRQSKDRQKTFKWQGKGSQRAADNKENKETMCVYPKGTHTHREERKNPALPPVTPLGGAPAGKRPQVNSVQHNFEQDSSPHRSSDINPTAISAGVCQSADTVRPQESTENNNISDASSKANETGDCERVIQAGVCPPAVTKDLTQREWRVYSELKGHNEFEAADFWIKQRGKFDEIQKRKVREFLKANGEQVNE